MTVSVSIAFIAMHGAAFSGKDLGCQVLRAAAHPDVVVIEARFAEAIYEMLRVLVPQAHSGMSKEDKELPREELGGLSIRQMAIAIGEGARKWRDDSWVEIWESRLRRSLEAALNGEARKILVLVPDLRKPPEREAFYRFGTDYEAEISASRPWINTLVGTELVMVFAENGQTNEQHDAATETQMNLRHGDLEVVNDQRQGPAAYSANLLSSLTFSSNVGLLFEQIFNCKARFHDVAEKAVQSEANERAKWAAIGLPEV